MALVFCGKGFGWTIRSVRVVQMDPRKERGAVGLFDPRKRLVENFIGRPLNRREGNRAHVAQIEVVKVGVEPLIDAPLAREYVSGNESARPITAALENLGQSELIGTEKESTVVAHPMLRWESSRK